MEEIKIEKGIPVPETKSIRYPFAEMAVGDSFFLGKPARTVRGSARHAARKLGINIATRKVGDGVRFWRLS